MRLFLSSSTLNDRSLGNKLQLTLLVMMENFFAGLENSSSKIRRIVLCRRRKTRTSLTSTPPFPFLFSETSELEARVLKSQSIRKHWGAFPSGKMTTFEIKVGINSHASSVSSCQGRSRCDLVTPNSALVNQEHSTAAANLHKEETPWTHHAWCLWALPLQLNTFWCAPGAYLPIQSHQQESVCTLQDWAKTTLKHCR